MADDAFLRISNIVKDFDGHRAVDNVSIDIAKGEVFALLGSSGCGKTTLLRMLAGFETPTSGHDHARRPDLAGLPPYERPMNMMFQSYALFPHLSVFDNIAFGLRRDGLPTAEVAARVEAMLKLVQLGAFAKRKPHQLSGGQQQRVALARSLAKKPQLLLLDEPLGALDKKLREETQIELANIIEDVGVTCVMVTHDQEEAMTMASRIAVMSEGRFLQVGAPAEIYETPASRFVADFIGNVNLMDGTLVEDEADHVVVDCGDCRHCVGHGITGTRGMAVTVALRPEKIRLRRDAAELEPACPTPASTAAHGTIKDMAYFGSFTVYHLQLASGRVLKISQSNAERQPGAPLTWGDAAWASWTDLVAGGADAMKRCALAARGRFAVIGIPYCWLLVFFLLPFLVVARISVSEMETTTHQGHRHLEGRRDRHQRRSSATTCCWSQDDLYLAHLRLEPEVRGGDDRCSAWRSATRSPTSWRAPRRSLQPALLMLVMLPFWTSFLLRVYAWKALLTEQGLVAERDRGDRPRPRCSPRSA